MKIRMLTIVALFCAALLPAEVEFSGLDLADSGELVFGATLDAPPFGTYRALMLADLPRRQMKQLTVFPERLIYLRETGQLQFQNRFGVFRSDTSLRSPEPIEGFAAFVDGRTADSGKTMPIEASPDGHYLVYTESTSPAYGTLVLYDLRSDSRTEVATGIELSLSQPPVRWSPDSEIFIYRKSGELFYFSLHHHREGRQLSESLRTIGPGLISSVRWADNGDLYYVSGTMVYRIGPNELFARTLYRDLLQTGTIAGKLPFPFEPGFDRFWVAPDARSILLSKADQNLFAYMLSRKDYASDQGALQLPYVRLPRSARLERVAWNREGIITMVISTSQDGVRQRHTYRLSGMGRPQFRLERLDQNAPVRDIVPSPDGTRVAVLYENRVAIRDYSSWRQLHSIDHEEPLHVVWPDDGTVVIAGRSFTERVTLSGRQAAAGGNEAHRAGTRVNQAVEREILVLSQPERAGFDLPGRNVAVQTGGRTFLYQREQHDFREARWAAIRVPRTASARYRVYLETHSSGSYRNTVMVRDTIEMQTSSLFLPPQRDYDPFPDDDQAVDLTHFVHGSRVRAREVAFAVNAIGSVEGLTRILATLDDYGIRTTFFVNGDFILRHPDAVREIASSGHEVGSLFYTWFDMTDSRYRIDREFIRRGLARNEDAYFAATGRELSLLWHTPYYFVSPLIISVSREMNYTFVDRDVDSLDWVPKRSDAGTSALYHSTADIIERVVQRVKPGSIVSLTVGVPLEEQPWGGRDDYLFNELDLLINRLKERGYSVVPVSRLIEQIR